VLFVIVSLPYDEQAPLFAAASASRIFGCAGAELSLAKLIMNTPNSVILHRTKDITAIHKKIIEIFCTFYIIKFMGANMQRQKLRRLLIITSMLLFPITLYYISPALIIEAGLKGVINGSAIVFMFLFISSIFFGRLFCAYICPAGGLLECAMLVNDKAIKHDWKNKIKYVIWLLWLIAVIFSYAKHDKYTIDFFYATKHGISVNGIESYIIYYIVVLLILLPSFICGKRATCLHWCWMAPFMVLGIKLRHLLHLPGLHIVLANDNCISCNQCNKACPMSIDVSKAVQSGGIDSSECIQCAACVDICSKNVLKYRMK
jgi:polyferredoxin